MRNHRTLQPNGVGFYESSGYSPNGEFIYTFTREGQRYCDDVWSLGAQALHPRNLTNSSTTWEEHGQYSSNGAWFGYVSSLFNPTLRFPGADNAELVSELYLQRTGGPAARMTYFNNATDEQAVSGVPGTVASPLHAGHAKSVAGRVVSRLSFSPDSRRVLMQVAPSDRIAPPQLWLQDLPR